MAGQPVAQSGGGVRERIGVEQTTDADLFGYEPIGTFIAQAARTELLECNQERIGEGIVHPGGEFGIAGRVRPVAVRASPHLSMGAADDLHRLLHLGSGSEAGGGHIGRGSRQPPERVGPVIIDDGPELRHCRSYRNGLGWETTWWPPPDNDERDHDRGAMYPRAAQ